MSPEMNLIIKTASNTTIMVSGIPPRQGLDVTELNNMLIDMCDYFNLQFIDHTEAFLDHYGRVKNRL